MSGLESRCRVDGREMDYKKEIITTIKHMSGRYAPYNLFTDWVEMSALTIQNTITVIHDKVWHDREQLYMDIARKYTKEELIEFSKMLGYLVDAMDEEMGDVLGEIYMTMGLGSKYTGQFFTPFHLSELCAKCGIGSLPETGKISLNEPSSGGGGMIIAACKVLHEAGFDFQRRLEVVAQDLDWKGVYMTYLQLSLIGCRAIVVQGDTLAEPYTRSYPRNRIMITPAKMGMLL